MKDEPNVESERAKCGHVWRTVDKLQVQMTKLRF